MLKLYLYFIPNPYGLSQIAIVFYCTVCLKKLYRFFFTMLLYVLKLEKNNLVATELTIVSEPKYTV